MNLLKKNTKRITGIILCVLMLFLIAIPVNAKEETITLSRPQLTASCLSQSTVSLKVKKVSQATGYIFYRSKQKSEGYTKIKTTNLNAYEDSGLSEGGYYYKVRAYIKSTGKMYYSTYSKVAYVKVSVVTKISSVINNTKGFDFTAYDSVKDKELTIGLLGNLVWTYDGRNTKYYGTDSALIAEFSGDSTSAFGIRSNTYVKKNEGEFLYRDIWLNSSGKLDASEDWYSDFVWVSDTIINIKTGKVLDQYKFENIYGSSSVYYGANFVDGIATIRVDGKYGLMDEKGNIVVVPSYELGWVVSGGYAIFENTKGKWAYCDAEGNMSEFKFSSLNDGGQSGILLGKIDKKYIYSNQEGNLMDLSEKLIINHGKEYSLCANLPNCSVELGTFSDGYAHAAIRYYYVDLKLNLNTYLAFDGFVDTQGKKRLDFTEHSQEDMKLLQGGMGSIGIDIGMLDISSSLDPISLDVSTQPSIDASSYFKYGLLLTETKLLNVGASEELSKGIFTAYGVYNKSGVQIMSIDIPETNRSDTNPPAGIVKAEVLGANCIAVFSEDNILTMKAISGANKISVPNVSNYETSRSTSGQPIVIIYTSVKEGDSIINSAGVYYDETGFYTGQYYAEVRKAYTGNDDMIFTMKEGGSCFVTGKNKIIIPAVDCIGINPTGEGYMSVKELSNPFRYKLTFYSANGNRISTAEAPTYNISALPYGAMRESGLIYTDYIVEFNNQYHNGQGKLINKTTFFTDVSYFNHGYTFVRQSDKDYYALMSSDGTLLSSYCFTKENAIYRSSNYGPNKYGSILIYLNERLYRVHKL